MNHTLNTRSDTFGSITTIVSCSSLFPSFVEVLTIRKLVPTKTKTNIQQQQLQHVHTNKHKMVSKTSMKKRSGSEARFPGKLHDMMQYIEEENLDSVISWVLKGRGFMIHDPEKLVDILPLFFGLTKYRSFRRQLNMWHFERVLDGPNKGAFIHPYFVRDNRSLCALMSRQISLQSTSGVLNKSSSENSFDEKKPIISDEAQSPPKDTTPTEIPLLADIEKDLFPIIPSAYDFISTKPSQSPQSTKLLSAAELLSNFDADVSAFMTKPLYQQYIQNQALQPSSLFQFGSNKEISSSANVSMLDYSDFLNDGDLVPFEGRSFFFVDSS